MGKSIKTVILRYQVQIIAACVVSGFVIAGSAVLQQWSDMSGYHAWDTDFSRQSGSMDTFVALGDADSMTPIDTPVWKAVSEVTWLGDKSPVIVVHIADPARAYPLSVLIAHGVVNDTVGSVMLAVTFCPLCNSPIVYDRLVAGDVLRFGTTGTIRNGGLVMWDDRTQSWWQQLTGEAIVGAYMGVHLDIVPSQVVGFRVFADRYPAGVVLVGDAALPSVSYGRNPYIGYDSNPQPFLYTETIDSRLFATERVLAGYVDGQPMAYPFSVLSRVHVINDTLDDSPVVAFWEAGANSTQDTADIDASRDVGMAMLFNPLVNGHWLTFRYDNGMIRDNQTNSTWDIFGTAMSGEMAGAMLMPYNAYPYFWFAWAANAPDTGLYTAP